MTYGNGLRGVPLSNELARSGSTKCLGGASVADTRSLGCDPAATAEQLMRRHILAPSHVITQVVDPEDGYHHPISRWARGKSRAAGAWPRAGWAVSETRERVAPGGRPARLRSWWTRSSALWRGASWWARRRRDPGGARRAGILRLAMVIDKDTPRACWPGDRRRPAPHLYRCERVVPNYWRPSQLNPTDHGRGGAALPAGGALCRRQHGAQDRGEYQLCAPHRQASADHRARGDRPGAAL